MNGTIYMKESAEVDQCNGIPEELMKVEFKFCSFGA